MLSDLFSADERGLSVTIYSSYLSSDQKLGSFTGASLLSIPLSNGRLGDYNSEPSGLAAREFLSRRDLPSDPSFQE